MNPDPAALYALSVICISLVVGFVFLFYRITNEVRVERVEGHKLLLDLVERLKADNLQEVVSAEAMREDLERQ